MVQDYALIVQAPNDPLQTYHYEDSLEQGQSQQKLWAHSDL